MIFLRIFFIYKKFIKDSSLKDYQKDKERLQKKAGERYQNLSEKGKEKNNMGVNDAKTSQKMKNKGRLNRGKTWKILKSGKMLTIIETYNFFMVIIYCINIFLSL